MMGPRTRLLGVLILVHAASAILTANYVPRRHFLRNCGVAVVAAGLPRPSAAESAVDDARDRAERYAAFAKTLQNGDASKNDLDAALDEMVSFEKALEKMVPTREAAKAAKELKKLLGDLDAAVKADDSKLVAARVGEVSDKVAFLAETLASARNSGIFLDDQVIGKQRSDWVPGAGYEQMRAFVGVGYL